MTPQGGASFDSRDILWTNLEEVHKEVPHIKSPRHPVSEKKNFEDGLLCSYVPTCHILNLHAILFQRRKILKMGFFVPMFQLVTPGTGPVLTPGASYEQFNRGPHGDAIYQISNLYAIQFQKRKILKIGFFVPMFQLVTPGMGQFLTPGASNEHTW